MMRAFRWWCCGWCAALTFSAVMYGGSVVALALATLIVLCATLLADLLEAAE